MGVLVILLLNFGAFCFTTATECAPETAKCSKYWQKTLPHKHLISTEDELNAWCSKQDQFYECLEDVLLENKDGNSSLLPTTLLISKLFSQDLCLHDSTSRKRLIDTAGCINQLNTDFCVLPEYLDIVTPDDSIPSTRCSQAEKTFSCTAATIVLNCGFDAGRVYRTLLKITRYSDEICGIETSEGIPPCEDDYKSAERDKKLSDIYYGLVHKIGSVLDQGEDQSELSDFASEKPVEDIVVDVLQSAIDNLDTNVISEDCDNQECLESASSIPCMEDQKEYEPYMKNPIITEIFKEILFYNYSDQEYSLYWRQPEFTVIDNIECEHLQPSYMQGVIFRCKVEYRHNDPDCVSNETVFEKITPQFIRNFDPEVPCDGIADFGPRPEWMKVVDEAYEERKVRNQMKSTPSATTDIPNVFTTSSSLLHIASSTYSNKKPEKWYDFDLQANNMNSIFPNDVHNEMMDLFIPNPERYTPPPMNRVKVGDTLFFLIYDQKIASGIENLKCSRLDECNPQGRGLWKCKIWPRKIETCDGCEMSTEESIIDIPVIDRPAELQDSRFTVVEVTESPVMEEGSGMLSDEALDESISLIFSGDTEDEIKLFDQPVDEVQSENDFEPNEADFVEDEVEVVELKGSDGLEYKLAVDSDDEDDDKVQFQIVGNVLAEDEESEPSEVVYEINDSDIEDESQVVTIDEDGLLTGAVLLLRNLSDLSEAKYTFISTSHAG